MARGAYVEKKQVFDILDDVENELFDDILNEVISPDEAQSASRYLKKVRRKIIKMRTYCDITQDFGLNCSRSAE